MENIRITYEWLKSGRKKDVVRYPAGIERLGLSGSEFRVYLYLMQKIGPADTAEASYNEMADYLNLDRKSVMNGIKGLEKRNLLQRFKRETEGGFKEANAYALFQAVMSE
ncbi:hypothetical protein D1872_54790 [compost metagenome]